MLAVISETILAYSFVNSFCLFNSFCEVIAAWIIPYYIANVYKANCCQNCHCFVSFNFISNSSLSIAALKASWIYLLRVMHFFSLMLSSLSHVSSLKHTVVITFIPPPVLNAIVNVSLFQIFLCHNISEHSLFESSSASCLMHCSSCLHQYGL